MTVEMVMDLCRQTLSTGFWVTLPILVVAIATGLLVSVFQAATQIQEASLAFVPKLAAVCASLVLFGGWMIERLSTFTIAVISSAGQIGGGP